MYRFQETYHEHVNTITTDLQQILGYSGQFFKEYVMQEMDSYGGFVCNLRDDTYPHRGNL